MHTHQNELNHVAEEGEHVLSANVIFHTEDKMLVLPVLFPHVHKTFSHLNSS